MRWPSSRRTAALVLLTVALVGGCSSPQTPATPEPAPSDAPAGNVVRGPFCDRVSPTGVEHALADVPADSESWGNGDRVRLPDGSRDRVQEYGCRWTAADGSQASAWVFAAPVTAAEAGALRRGVLGDAYGADCRVVGDAADFGAPGATATCTLDTGNSIVERAGLFGDAWLTCSVSAPGAPDDLSARATEWCAEVVAATRG